MRPWNRLRFTGGSRGEKNIHMCIGVARDSVKGLCIAKKVAPRYILFTFGLCNGVAAFTRKNDCFWCVCGNYFLVQWEVFACPSDIILCEDRFRVTDTKTGSYLVWCETVGDSHNSTPGFDDTQVDGNGFSVHGHINCHGVSLFQTDVYKSVCDSVGQAFQFAIGECYEIVVVFALRNNCSGIIRSTKAAIDDVEFSEVCCGTCCVFLCLGICVYRFNAQPINHHLPKRVTIGN